MGVEKTGTQIATPGRAHVDDLAVGGERRCRDLASNTQDDSAELSLPLA
jgi:hypothetical protein